MSRRDFDVVLSDLGLPDIPGDVLIRQIHSASRRRARIIVVIGYGGSSTTCSAPAWPPPPDRPRAPPR